VFVGRISVVKKLKQLSESACLFIPNATERKNYQSCFLISDDAVMTPFVGSSFDLRDLRDTTLPLV